jgi:hypothetical protein
MLLIRTPNSIIDILMQTKSPIFHVGSSKESFQIEAFPQVLAM